MTLTNRTIEVITGELQGALRREAADILGGLLAEAKAQLPHGEWLPWLENELSMSERSAQKYVKAADFAAKYELGADLKISPSALFLISRYDQREIADAVIKAAKQKHVGCDQAKEIIDKKLAELEVANEAKSEGGPNKLLSAAGGPRSRVNPSNYLLTCFTAAVRELLRTTKNRQADRFTKCPFEADILADLGELLTEISTLKATPAALETSVDPVA